MKKSLLLLSLVGVFGIMQAQQNYLGRLYTWYKGPKKAVRRDIDAAMNALNRADVRVAVEQNRTKKITVQNHLINPPVKQAIAQAKDALQAVIDAIDAPRINVELGGPIGFNFAPWTW